MNVSPWAAFVAAMAATAVAACLIGYPALRLKGHYLTMATLGFGLIVWGYGLARQQPVSLWAPMPWARHLASLLTLLAFVLLVAAYVPGNSIKARLHHPMILGVKLWALAHLLANHTLADLLLFGGFLLWAVLSFRAARQRDRKSGVAYQATGFSRDAIVVIIGLAVWVAFAFSLHGVLIGVRPFG